MLKADPAHLLAVIVSALLSAGALAGTADASGTGTRFAPPPAVAAAPPLATTPIQPVPPPEAVPASPPVASAAPSALRPGAGSWPGPSWPGPSWGGPSWGGPSWGDPSWPGQYRPVGPRDPGPSPSYLGGAGVAANPAPSERPRLSPSPSPSTDGPLPGPQAPAWRAASAPIAVGPPAYLPALLIIGGLFSLFVSGTGLVVVAWLRRQW